jgi:ubiquinone/menaquinone biosynthesis C-methylase UbiE
VSNYLRLHDWQARQRRERPLIPDGSVDMVLSNCVLNLVRNEDKGQLVSEIFRVLRPGGRVALSDIVSDKPVPVHLLETSWCLLLVSRSMNGGMT